MNGKRLQSNSLDLVFIKTRYQFYIFVPFKNNLFLREDLI